MDTSSSVSAESQSASSKATFHEKGKRAVRAGGLAFFVDAFDAYVPVIALAPAQIYFVPDYLPTATKATIAYVVFFTISWIGRPIGAFIFGHIADTMGRRKTTLISVAGFGLATLAMGLLPGYQAVGIASVIAFAILRLIGGVFIGGEYTGAAPLAVEYAPRSRRGLWGALCNVGYPAGLAANTLFVFILLYFIPSGTLNSPYTIWGWRIPFGVGVLLAAFVFVYYYRSVSESEVWASAEKEQAPIKQLFLNRSYRSRFLQVCTLMLGAWLTLNAVAGSLPTFLKTVLKIDSTYATLAYLVSTIIGAALFPLIGLLGQRIGRKQMYVLLGIVNLTLTPMFYVWLVAAGYRSAILTMALVILIQLPTLAVWALVTAYITETFPTQIRSTAYGLGFSLTTVPAAFYSFAMLGLGHVMPYKYTVAIVLAMGGLCMLIGALRGPDNRSVDFHPEVTPSLAGTGRASSSIYIGESE